MTLSRGWVVRQLVVSNAFLNGELEEEVNMYHPKGFVNQEFPHYVCRLEKALNELKQALKAWYN